LVARDSAIAFIPIEPAAIFFDKATALIPYLMLLLTEEENQRQQFLSLAAKQ
jgi:hypothetical protein